MKKKVVVRFHRRAAPGLAQWMLSLVPLGELRRVYYRATIEELKRRLAESQGEVPEAHLTGEGENRAFWWQFTPGLWVGYRWRDRGRWLWKRREVIVISIAEHLPGPEA
jgi:hypothetical protein